MDRPVDLAWATSRSCLYRRDPVDWWWNEFVLAVHHGSAISVGFAGDSKNAYAIYLDTEVLLIKPTIEEAELLLKVLELNRFRKLSHDQQQQRTIRRA